MKHIPFIVLLNLGTMLFAAPAGESQYGWRSVLFGSSITVVIDRLSKLYPGEKLEYKIYTDTAMNAMDSGKVYAVLSTKLKKSMFPEFDHIGNLLFEPQLKLMFVNDSLYYINASSSYRIAKQYDKAIVYNMKNVYAKDLPNLVFQDMSKAPDRKMDVRILKCPYQFGEAVYEADYSFTTPPTVTLWVSMHSSKGLEIKKRQEAFAQETWKNQFNFSCYPVAQVNVPGVSINTSFDYYYRVRCRRLPNNQFDCTWEKVTADSVRKSDLLSGSYANAGNLFSMEKAGLDMSMTFKRNGNSFTALLQTEGKTKQTWFSTRENANDDRLLRFRRQ